MYDQLIVVEDGVIISINPSRAGDIKPDHSCHYIAPSFIDLQIYGARGKLFSMYPSPDTLQAMYEHCLEGGTGCFLATIATNTNEVICKSIDAVRDYWRRGGKGLAGLHLEGPWINPLKRGAHIEAFIKTPDVEDVFRLLEYGHEVIKMITLAPEICNIDVIKLINSYDINISAGHSNATFAEASACFSNGVRAVTHLYNAMSTFHHRGTGLPGATFEDAMAMSSIIVDGYHADFSAIRIAKKIMGDRLYLITDAVTETKEGPYQHSFHEGRYLSNNTLSGSALTMAKAVKNCANHCDIPAAEALRMASLYPARLMNMQGGRLAINEKASFILMDESLNLISNCI